MQRNPLAPLRPLGFDERAARHLLNRAGFGGPPEAVRELAEMGLRRAVDRLADFHEINAEPVRADLFNPNIVQPRNQEERREVMLARQRGDEQVLERFRREVQARQRADRQQMRAIQQWWMQRILTTPRPLEEKLTLFWHGHFACSYRPVEDSYHLFMQNQLFRRHAAGSFAELVHGIIRDPAMLKFLNNDQNRRRAPNENLARELLELFTMGEGRGYTERDIREGARALTGYTFYDDAFVFRRDWHDPGVKQILRQRGAFNGDDFVRIILEQRAASEYICYKLYRFFVNDDPDTPRRNGREVVEAMARDLRRARYQLRPVLKRLFSSQHFYDEANRGAVIKSPVQLIAQAARSFNIEPTQVMPLVLAAAQMGQTIFYPPSVNGWESGRMWINTASLFGRQNVLAGLLTGTPAQQLARRRQVRVRVDVKPFMEPARFDDGSLRIEPTIVHLLESLMAIRARPEHVRTLTQYVIDRGGKFDEETVRNLILTITAMPEYQVC